jgi:hypothetical protein
MNNSDGKISFICEFWESFENINQDQDLQNFSFFCLFSLNFENLHHKQKSSIHSFISLLHFVRIMRKDCKRERKWWIMNDGKVCWNNQNIHDESLQPKVLENLDDNERVCLKNHWNLLLFFAHLNCTLCRLKILLFMWNPLKTFLDCRFIFFLLKCVLISLNSSPRAEWSLWWK